MAKFYRFKNKKTGRIGHTGAIGKVQMEKDPVLKKQLVWLGECDSNGKPLAPVEPKKKVAAVASEAAAEESTTTEEAQEEVAETPVTAEAKEKTEETTSEETTEETTEEKTEENTTTEEATEENAETNSSGHSAGEVTENDGTELEEAPEGEDDEDID